MKWISPMRVLAALLTVILSCAALPWAAPSRAAYDSVAETDIAVFAGGCFWCMESDFQDLAGVVDVVSGFTGGRMENPTYSGDHRGHYEAVKITFDPEQVTYPALLEHYWRSVDPFDDGGQFCDRGHSYKPAIFPQDDSQRQQAEASLQSVVARFPDKKVVTPILPAATFWPVEEYHQDYYLKNPIRYKFYRWNCGRDQRLTEIWGDEANRH